MLNLIFEIFLSFNRLLDSLVVECLLRVRDVPGSIPSQGPRHTKDVIKMVPVVPLFSTQHWKGKYWLFLKNLGKKKMMKWIKFGIEILRSRRSLAVVVGMKKRMTTQNRQKMYLCLCLCRRKPELLRWNPFSDHVTTCLSHMSMPGINSCCSIYRQTSLSLHYSFSLMNLFYCQSPNYIF